MLLPLYLCRIVRLWNEKGYFAWRVWHQGFCDFRSTMSLRHKEAVFQSPIAGVPLETYIPSEKLAIESGSADENLEIMKAYMCKQRGIRLIKLPMKGTELDYANNLKKAFQSVHIFISSDTEEDVEIIKNTFERWRDSQ